MLGWVLGLGSGLGFGCGDDAGSEAGVPAATQPAHFEPIAWPAWGPPAPAHFEPAYVDAQLRRASGDAGLGEAIGFADARRLEALWSLARIGGPGARHRLEGLLDGDEASPAALATLGLLESPDRDQGASEEWMALEDALWTRYAVEDRGPEAVALLFAIARIGGDRSVRRLGVDLAVLPSSEAADAEIERFDAAMRALGIACARGANLDDATRDVIASALDEQSPRVELAATYALGRCARASSESFGVEETRKVIAQRLAGILDGASDEQRRLAWIALGALGEVPEIVHPSILGAPPPVWWVEVEAVRALVQTEGGRTIALERASTLGPAAFAGARVHVLLELLAGLRAHPGSLASLEAQLRTMTAAVDAELEAAQPRRSKELALVRCELGALAAIRGGSLEPLRTCRGFGLALDPTPRLEVEALLAMTEGVMDRQTRLDALVVRAESPDPKVAAPALAALAEVNGDPINGVLRSALEREDLGVVAAAAGAVAARSRDAAKRSMEVVPALRRVVTGASNGAGIEARLAAIEALGVLARRPERGLQGGSGGKGDGVEAPWLESVLLPLARDPAFSIRRQARAALLGNPELLERFDRPVPTAGRDAFGEGLEADLAADREAPAAGLRVNTEAGSFVIDLRGVRAPINRANLLGLVRRQFYDGLRFHRVASAFVVQGGDPRGDGYGGPGHLVPCEWSHDRYDRGMVGMALAGKDTGGSQFFITQTPQPHLDGRYTVIGRVSEGMEVVDRILPGDAIESIDVLDHIPDADVAL